MRVLVQIHTWNDADVIGAALAAILRQSRAPEAILIVDNASTDGTLQVALPDMVNVVRHELNLGTSGAVKTGLQYARDHGYDWLWILDADSVPRPDALERLVDLAEQNSATGENPVGVSCASHHLVNLGRVVQHGRLLTPGGPRRPTIRSEQSYIECDSVIWSGALINPAVIDKVGLPRAGKHGCWQDLSLDYGDTEFTYRVHRGGYRVLVHRYSIIDHPLGRGLYRRILGHDFYTSNHRPFRRYLHFRNLVFFWLYIYERRNWPMLLVWFSYRLMTMLAAITFMESDRGPKLRACLIGICDGLRGRLDGNIMIPGAALTGDTDNPRRT